MAVLLQYNFTSGLSPSTEAAGVTGSDVTSQSLTSFQQDTPGYASDPVLLTAPPSSTTDITSAINNQSFFYFTLTPQSGQSVSLTSLDFNVSRGGSAVPRGYDVRTNRTGTNYDTTVGAATIPTQRFTWTPVSIDLSGAEYQNVTSSISFRIYVYAPSTLTFIDFDDITINGSVASGGTVSQEGFRWRDDNGNETTATYLAPQDTNIIRQKNQTTRLRVILDSTGDRAVENYTLEHRKVGDTEWVKIAP